MGLRNNPSKSSRRGARLCTLVAAFLLVFAPTRLAAQEQASQVVEVYWQSSETRSFPGLTQIVVLDESICRLQVSGDQVEFFGLSRGETLAFAWVQEQRISIQVRVFARPAVPSQPSLSNGALDALGSGFIGSSAQTSAGSTGNPDFLFLHHLDWQQQNGQTRLGIHAQAQDSTVPGSPLFNTNSASVEYSTPRTALSLIDFPLTVNGGSEARLSPYSTYNVYMVRGADVMLRRGANQFELFSGVTVPSFYLDLEGTRDVAGFNFNRKQSDQLYLYSTTGWVNSPFSQLPSGAIRENSFFESAGAAYRPNSEWALQGTAGGGTRGHLEQGTITYTGGDLTAFLAGTASSPDFPLNQLQLFFAGGSSLTGGATLKFDSRLSSSLYYQHSALKATALFPAQGVADYLNPSLSFAIHPREDLTLNYAYTRNRSDLTIPPRSQGQRFDVVLNSRFGKGMSNTGELTVGALSDPLQFNAQSELTVRDTFNIPTRLGYVTLAFQQSSSDPSLAKRLRDYINLLPPGLRQLLLLDAAAFTLPSELPPEVRDLLDSLHPTDTELSASAQLKIGSRLNLSPTVGYVRNAAGLGQNSSSNLLGYALSYQATRSLQFVSSLSNVFLLDPHSGGLRRTTMMTFGFNKNLHGTPRWLPFHEPRHTIHGRVFRDLNVNGAFNDGEPGIAGVRVDLDSGDSVLTDSRGRFEFTALKPGDYRVSVPLSQFTEAVKATGPTDVHVDLTLDRTAEVNFGIVNFGTVMGNAFNDLLLDGKRRPDANGLPRIRLVLAGSTGRRDVVTDGTGDYEFDEVFPGDYALTVDRGTLPPDFMVSAEPIRIHVAPISTTVEDIPLQALRSLSGHVYFRSGGDKITKVSSQNEVNRPEHQTLQPLAGVQIAVDKVTATTDAEGGFVLRNLPAGELVLTLVPTSPLPSGIEVPMGKVRMPLGPLQAENATIVLSNRDLLKYVLPIPSGSEQGGK